MFFIVLGLLTFVVTLFLAVYAIKRQIKSDKEYAEELKQKEIEDKKREREQAARDAEIIAKFRKSFEKFYPDTSQYKSYYITILQTTVFKQRTRKNDFFCWRDETKLHIRFHLNNYIKKNKEQLLKLIKSNTLDYLDFPYWDIPVEDIQYYTLEGEKEQELIISGGDGGGSSVKGAIIGGVIVGDTGAIVGSRQGTNPIEGRTITNDQRYTALYFLQDGKTYRMLLTKDSYEAFKIILPDKSYDYVRVQQSSAMHGSQQITSVEDRLFRLNELRNKQLISQEEYDKKRTEILKEI